ncbi:MAG: RDD family protein [Bacteroidia bacterium]
MTEQTTPPTPPAYAGFWLRFVAFILDALILGAAKWIILAPLLALFGISTIAAGLEHPSASPESMLSFSKLLALITVAAIYSAIILCVLYWLYYALMESSSKQATVGKMALGLKVTGLNGERISFGKASGRFFAKYISGLILFIGYMMAGFTEKKQALHDIVSDCLVVKK